MVTMRWSFQMSAMSTPAATSVSIGFESSRASGLNADGLHPHQGQTAHGRPDRRRGTEDHARKVLAKQLVVMALVLPANMFSKHEG
jgi:hypothetical protein